MLESVLLAFSLVQPQPLEPISTVSVGSTVPCVADTRTLCLLGDRVEVRARFRNQHDGGKEGVGTAIPFGEKSGFFWFFDDQNIELLVKALDGAAINESVWVFVGSLSDVEFWVDVTDTVQGQRRTYYNPPGNTYGLVDTEAFPSDGTGSFCGGIAGIPCPTAELLCDPEPGMCQTADVAGLCVRDPEGVCPEIYSPVCGCDGVTYSNDCERISAGVAKDFDGTCENGPSFCGGIAGFPCPEGQVCDPDPGMCQTADVAGSCIVRPEACPAIYDPVCGCDGVTYSSDCIRQAAGVAKDHDGECDPGPGFCGGIAGFPCPEGQVCDPDPGMCQTADVAGACIVRPEACTAIYDPVCGCDGVTYSNDCVRQTAGVAKDHDGECNPGPGFCGGIAGFPCPEGQVCDPDPGMCQTADVAGACIVRPEVCPAIYDPVCGCDDVTYSSDCVRQAAGVAKDHDGECE